MSSSSELRSEDPCADCRASDHALTLLLAGIAKECSSIGTAISDVGDELSGAISKNDMTTVMLECQAFDRLAQVAHAQARLIAHIGRMLLEGKFASNDELLSVIEDVPTFDVRQRLRAAIGIAPVVTPVLTPVETDASGDGSVDLF